MTDVPVCPECLTESTGGNIAKAVYYVTGCVNKLSENVMCPECIEIGSEFEATGLEPRSSRFGTSNRISEGDRMDPSLLEKEGGSWRSCSHQLQGVHHVHQPGTQPGKQTESAPAAAAMASKEQKTKQVATAAAQMVGADRVFENPSGRAGRQAQAKPST